MSPFLALCRKELRELWWLALLACAWLTWAAFDPGNGYQGAEGLHSDLPRLAFKSSWALGLVACALGFGFWQTLRESRPDRRALLVHRPLGRSGILAAKVLTAWALLLLALLPGLLGFVWCVHLRDGRPFLVAGLIFPAQALVLALGAHLAALASGWSGAPWWRSRAVPVAFALGCALLPWEGWLPWTWTLPAALAALLGLALIAVQQFRQDGEEERGHPAWRWTWPLLTCIFVAWTAADAILPRLTRSSLQMGEWERRWVSFDVRGQPLLRHRSLRGDAWSTTAGVPVTPQTELSLSPLHAPRPDPVHQPGEVWARGAWETGPEGERSCRTVAYCSVADGRIDIWDRHSRRICPLPAVQAGAPERLAWDAACPSGDAWVVWGWDGQGRPWWFQGAEAPLRLRGLDAAGADPVRGIGWLDQGQAMVLAGRTFALFDHAERRVFSVPLPWPDALPGDLAFARLPASDQSLLAWRPRQGRDPGEALLLSPAGVVLARHALPACPIPAAAPIPVQARMLLVAPVLRWFCPHLSREGGGSRTEPSTGWGGIPGWLQAGTAVGSLLLMLGLLALRRQAAGLWWWSLLALAFGPSALLVQLWHVPGRHRPAAPRPDDPALCLRD